MEIPVCLQVGIALLFNIMCSARCLIYAENGPSAPTNRSSRLCQNLDPSPDLTQFVDHLSFPPIIALSEQQQLTLGAYKIMQNSIVTSPPLLCTPLGRLKHLPLFLAQPCLQPQMCLTSSDGRTTLMMSPTCSLLMIPYIGPIHPTAVCPSLSTCMVAK
ncbi:hypothetical protein L7F22_023352 [Adiantum nelumboides]|nr:hypothetical protein [Adiantum nelumboides]